MAGKSCAQFSFTNTDGTRFAYGNKKYIINGLYG